jgi:hypothetical protein
MTRQEIHERKYRRMAEERHIKLTTQSLQFFGLRSLSDLKFLYLQDSNLNNIQLRRFDALTTSFNTYNPRKKLTLSEGACLYKQLLIDMITG